jgi:enterochelin esterase family protein
MKPLTRAALAVAALACAVAASAQQPNNPPRVTSPEVKSDRTVIFRLYAPKATTVTVNGEWGGQRPTMTKDDRGVWTATVGPLAPEMYSYSFSVDGAKTIDPSNTRLKIGRGEMSNLVEVPGNPAQDLRKVPHGTLNVVRYESKSLNGKSRSMVVYTPPGYETSGQTRYPVMYLLHGSGDDEHGWTDIGLAHRIVDNLLADEKAVPMLVVMPDGHPDTGANNTRAMEADVLGDIIPLVEKNYRVKTGPENRAIVGLSMGGAQSFTIGMGHLDTFAYVCPFSMGGGNATAIANNLNSAEANNRLKLLWIACGRQDRLFATSERLCEQLKTKGIRHEWHPSEGAHSWPVWRKYLTEVTPLLFRA